MLDIGSTLRALLGSSRTLAELLAAIGLNRLELLSIELQEQKSQAVQLGIISAMTVFAGLMAAIMGTALVVYLFDESYRLYVLIGFVALYGGAASMGLILIVYKLRSFPIPFASTIAELKKDKQLFMGDGHAPRADHEPSPSERARPGRDDSSRVPDSFAEERRSGL